MIDLKDYSKEIEQFIINGLHKCRKEKGEPNSIGIYCCPWSGWVSLNFNINKSLEETEQNCPDFEFVEYDLVDFTSWSDEYESNNPEWLDSLYGNSYFDNGLGNEDLNSLFYRFLSELINTINKKEQLPTTILQLLDSSYNGKIINAQIEKLGKFIVQNLRDEQFETYKDFIKNVKIEGEKLAKSADEEFKKLELERIKFIQSLSPEQLKALEKLILSTLDNSVFIFLRAIQENLGEINNIEMLVDNTRTTELETDLVSGNLFGDYFVWLENYSKFGGFQH